MELQRRKYAEGARVLYAKVAQLESINDQLAAEVHYIDTLLRQVGFDEGLCTLKQAAAEIIEGSMEEIE